MRNLATYGNVNRLYSTYVWWGPLRLVCHGDLGRAGGKGGRRGGGEEEDRRREGGRAGAGARPNHMGKRGDVSCIRPSLPSVPPSLFQPESPVGRVLPSAGCTPSFLIACYPVRLKSLLPRTAGSFPGNVENLPHSPRGFREHITDHRPCSRRNPKAVT